MTTTKKMGAGVSGKPEDGPSFEKSLERLETIVGEMEDGKLGLEDMIARFEEGQKLIKFCSIKLNEVERKIELLVKKGDKIETEPFEPEALDAGNDAEERGGATDKRKKEDSAEDEPF
jgi:exodeoxyribonuclease VII small subunit